MFKIGDKVYCCRGTRYRNLEVVDISQGKVLCEGEEGVKNRYDEIIWKTCRHFFSPYELSTQPYVNNKSYVKENKWDDIIQRIPNMCSSVLYMYEDYLEGKLNLTPFYQRDLVWTLGQKQKYLEAVFEDKATISPTIILNWDNYCSDAYEVLDGKQRLSAVFGFINNEFPIFDGVYFSDLSSRDRCFILDTNVLYTRIHKINRHNLTDNEKIELFLEINELGTKMSQEHIDKIKNMINQ